MITILASVVLASSAPVAAIEPEPLVIGESYSFDALDAERSVNVILPPDYEAEPEKSWPIIVQLDGGTGQDLFLGNGVEKWNGLWGRSRPAILVGIQTVDRQRELLPTTRIPEEREAYPTAGESAQFRSWLGDTVLPLVKSRYRHDGTVVLVGESAAGHFVVETWLEEPSLFTGYAAISPSLQWDGQAMALAAESAIDGRPPLYLSLADEGGETEQGMFRLLSKLDADQSFCFSDRRNDLHHSTSLHGLMPEALQFLLPTGADWLEDYGLTLRCEQGGPESGAE
ncbi:alpha/beta hydrolase [Qipengyuania aurantiaca]|uniref:Alpha/beta hydrolase n=1 Tax=Qipengyuania aurantiaca TaxID=2867233 RepID=A0ABX8ZK42_9SPHN|nr:alpha/beta hydrolase-fold protein [Qipengyuania aurantiaca]QZD89327.1 alpha/beta hydrolase [Qipengyuania aurantiaca]